MILATGANGMLGSYFKDKNILKTDIVGTLPTLDVTDYEAVFKTIKEYKPEFVLHLAAETDVDKCEYEIDHAYRVNYWGTYNIARACQELGPIMIYISTAGVFSGDKPEPYNEFDAPGPANVYGHTKLQGENAVRQLLNKYYIFRSGWMIGGGPGTDKKFVGKMLELMSTRDEVSVVNDKFGSITYANDLANGILKLIRTGKYGLYHLCNQGFTSRFDIAQEIARVKGFNVKINPICSAKFPLPAPRARSEAMVNYKLNLLGLNPMRYWKDALAAYIAEWPKDTVQRSALSSQK